MVEELHGIVASVGGFLADLLARIIKGIKSLAPVIALGCQGPTVTPSKVDNKQVGMISQQPTEKSDEPKPIGDFTVTFYYVIGEDEIKKKPVADKSGGGPTRSNAEGDAKVDDNSPELAAVSADQDQVTLFEAGTCKEIADVSHDFASQLALQGTGKLKDGRVLNIWGRCKCSASPCFKVTENQWGTAGSNHPLQPFRTVAVDPKVVKLGTLLYVPLLEGRMMPGHAPWGGFVHDGCVVADDTGGHIDGNRLDLFVGRKAYFLGLSGSGSSHAWAKHVPVFDGSQICERKGRKISRKSGSI
jgi:3D (Asp-Asp-Asp) domain-containing protein